MIKSDDEKDKLSKNNKNIGKDGVEVTVVNGKK